jgi:hypothetical protein
MREVAGSILALRQTILIAVVCRLFSLRKEPRGRPRPRWEDIIKMGLSEIGWEGVDLADVAQDGDMWQAVVDLADVAQDGDMWQAVVDTVLNIRVP